MVIATMWNVVVSLYVIVAIEAVLTVVIPIAVCALSLLSASLKLDVCLRWTCVALLLAWVFLGLASVGLLYLPGAAAMTIAAVETSLKRGRT